MANDKRERPKIVVDRREEMRTKETSRMISEGGLGSRAHYNVKKVSSPEAELEEIKKREEKRKKAQEDENDKE